MEELANNTHVSDITHVFITHLDPKSIPTLKEVLTFLAGAGKKPTVVLSNPGLRLLQSVFGESLWMCHCDCSAVVQLQEADSGAVQPRPAPAAVCVW